MIDKFAIVKLKKEKYDKEHVTEAEPAPRVLIIRTYADSQQYLVRYPDSFIHRVNADWVTTKSIFTMQHVSYPTLAIECPQVFREFMKNDIFKTVLGNVLPALALDFTQRMEAKHQAIKANMERHQTPAPTLVELMPTLPEITNSDTVDQITLLKSIDVSLKTLIQLWGGQQ